MVNFNRWSLSAEIKALVGAFVAEMKVDLAIKKVDGYKANMKVLLMELYHSYLTDPAQYIAYPRSPEQYNFKVKLAAGGKGNRYQRNFNVTHTYFVGCVDYLVGKGFIENQLGGYFRDGDNGNYGYLSRMRAKEALVMLWEEYHFNPDMITKFRPEEIIILRGEVQKIPFISRKGKKQFRKFKPQIPNYAENRNIDKMRKVVEAYNDLLEHNNIDIDVDCMTQADREGVFDRLIHAKDKFKYNINLGSNQVYRVFNNGRFDQGGRFYGAWWIGCPKILRKYITINGEQTTELDYSGVHINLLYAIKGINYADSKDDPYELVPKDPNRKLNKLILLTSYNTKGENETAKAVFKDALDEGTRHKLKLKNHKQVIEILRQLKKKHSPVENCLADNFGSTLQFHDSSVMEQLISHFTKSRIPILSVHDSVICQSRYADMVLEKMKDIYSRYIYSKLRCHNDYRFRLPTVSHYFKYESLNSKYTNITDKIRTINALEPNHKFKGNLPSINIINVTSKTNSYICSGKCKCSLRFNSHISGKRTFKPKIIINTHNIDGITELHITQ